MKTFFWFLLFISLAYRIQGKIIRNSHAPPPIETTNQRASTPVWANITQRVDHFNPADERTWTMRYIYNDECFVSGGPIFIYLGGEWTISTGRLTTGQVYDMACEHNGYMFYTEHRYYGRSFPTEDFSSENLKYLSADQALADLAYFIKHQKENIEGLQNSTVVVAGGSYSATLATWARVKYPHLVDIAYSSSAPLDAKPDFYEYYEVINENLALVSPTCPDVIKSAISQIEDLLLTEDGVRNVSSMFNTCDVLNTTEPHRAFFFNSIGEIFAGLVQYASEGDIEEACGQIENATGTDLEKLASYVKTYLDSDCISSYDEFLESYASTNLTSDIYRQWTYQICTEYGWFQTTTSDNQPFGNTFPIDLFYQMCKDLFGEAYNEYVVDVAVERTNTFYGGYEPELTRVISVHGTVDPWHPMGILQDLHDLAPVILIQGTSHCADLSSVQDSDLEQLKQAKNTVKETIAKWLRDIETGETSSSSNPKTNALTMFSLIVLVFLTSIVNYL